MQRLADELMCGHYGRVTANPDIELKNGVLSA